MSRQMLEPVIGRVMELKAADFFRRRYQCAATVRFCRLVDEEPNDCLVDLEKFPQQRRLTVLAFFDEIKNAVVEQRGLGREDVSRLEFLALGTTDQVQREVNAWMFTRYIVLQVRIEGFVPRFQLRRESHQQDVYLRLREVELCSQVKQAEPDLFPACGFHPAIDLFSSLFELF